MRRALVAARRRGAGENSGRSLLTPRVAAKARLQWDGVRHRHILLYPEGLVALNPTAAEILELCDGRRSVEDIITVLRGRYDSAEISSDVETLLAGLAAKGLVTYDDA